MKNAVKNYNRIYRIDVIYARNHRLQYESIFGYLPEMNSTFDRLADDDPNCIAAFLLKPGRDGNNRPFYRRFAEYTSDPDYYGYGLSRKLAREASIEIRNMRYACPPVR